MAVDHDVAVCVADSAGGSGVVVAGFARLDCFASAIGAGWALDSAFDLDAVASRCAVDSVLTVRYDVAVSVAYEAVVIVAAVGCAVSVDSVLAVGYDVSVSVAYLGWDKTDVDALV